MTHYFNARGSRYLLLHRCETSALMKRYIRVKYSVVRYFKPHWIGIVKLSAVYIFSGLYIDPRNPIDFHYTRYIPIKQYQPQPLWKPEVLSTGTKRTWPQQKTAPKKTDKTIGMQSLRNAVLVYTYMRARRQKGKGTRARRKLTAPPKRPLYIIT